MLLASMSSYICDFGAIQGDWRHGKLRGHCGCQKPLLEFETVPVTEAVAFDVSPAAASEAQPSRASPVSPSYRPDEESCEGLCPGLPISIPAIP
jgi:hypothetical protein